MNLQQAKALFFAQYLGQEIQYETIFGDKPVTSIGSIIGVSIDSDIIAHGTYEELLDLDIVYTEYK
ncbi:hypothetical protein [Mucilaginibacter sp.]|jgi:hypothetical protein|uniref:hypothetical protein n=1 Tax=Mucilaginibacter sp. TaxID=1882438 RepID=UPI003561716D